MAQQRRGEQRAVDLECATPDGQQGSDARNLKMRSNRQGDRADTDEGGTDESGTEQHGGDDRSAGV
ncbi:hypothetical protein WDA79_03080, partial [Streptomyces sp. A475]|uniref:hypothetical protein n=1 Tax=Streptomyces sp. A475 TaxID=3131976 RepID=UPI0030C918D9